MAYQSRPMVYRTFAVPFIRADTGEKDVIYLGNYNRRDAEAWLADRKEFCAKVLPANQTQRTIRELEKTDLEKGIEP